MKISAGLRSYAFSPSVIFALYLAVALQIQISIFQHGDYVGLRVNLGDFLIPLAGFYVLFSLLTKRSHFPQFEMRGILLWLVALSLVLVGAALIFYLRMGEVSQWALVNKLSGWFVLMAYFMLGGWVVYNGSAFVRPLFLRVFSGFFILGGLAGVLIFFAIAAGAPWSGFAFPYAALMDNRNAYGLLFLLVFIALYYMQKDTEGGLSDRAYAVIMLFVPYLALCVGGRALWILIAVLAMAWFVTNFRWSAKYVLLPLLLGSVLAWSFASYTHHPVTERKQISRVQRAVEAFTDKGEQALGTIHRTGGTDGKRTIRSEMIRIRNARDAVDLWKQHPLFGAGLGAMLAYQEQHYASKNSDIYVDIVDCTLLWLLAETGLVGVLVFLGFYGSILRALWRRAYQKVMMPKPLYLRALCSFFCWSLVLILYCTRCCIRDFCG